MKLQKPKLCFKVLILLLISTITTTSAILGNVIDHLSLLEFKKHIDKDPYNKLSSWNESMPLCNWYGITCNQENQRVTSLNLLGLELKGTLTPHIGNLTFLQHIVLENNTFYGQIPPQIGHLSRLQHFNLSNNSFTGEIPAQLFNCSNLRIIDFTWNKLVGKLPSEIGLMKNLRTVQLGENKLTGPIPPSICNVSTLTYFYIPFNNLVGSIPNEIGNLKRLSILSFSANKLSGIIPTSLFNISSLTTFYATQNNLEGSLPSDIGFTLPRIVNLGIAVNLLSGFFPMSFSNASKLQILDLSANNFVGNIPSELGNNLLDLRWVNFGRNNLGSNSTKDLEWLASLKNCSHLKILAIDSNQFGGTLPSAISNLSREISEIYFSGNYLYGNISTIFDKFSNLSGLYLDTNLFTGYIPSYFGKFQKLQGLTLSINRFFGSIPSSLGNLSSLTTLDLSYNMLEGNIPTSIWSFQYLQYLDISKNNLIGAIPEEITNLPSLLLLNLSHNSLIGNLPMKVGNLKSLNTLDVSNNNLMGQISTRIGDCVSLEYLNSSNNSFHGNIPSSFASLKGLVKLDLSRNNLSGNIPKDLENLVSLEYLDVSFNDLVGEMPSKGVFQNSSAILVMGNDKLCGGNKELKLPTCSIKAKRRGLSKALKFIIIAICILSFFLLSSLIAILYWKRKSKKKNLSTKMLMNLDSYSFPRVSYNMLYHSTEGFSPNNLIGFGSFGEVYKGMLDKEGVVAIKVLKLEQQKALKSFEAECKVLRSTRHRNLVSIITLCSTTNHSGDEFKALVLKFMENGSLEKWLHKETTLENQNDNALNLSLVQRLDIAIDVACALHYLHYECDPPIVHCDLKPSNVLLDNDMVAHVSDFGLARLLWLNDDGSENQTNTIGLKGSIGYMPPEYGMGGEVSIQGDIYSFGILILEMFIGKRPTNAMFEDGFNIHQFAKMKLTEKLMEIVDPRVVREVIEESGRTSTSNSENVIMASYNNRVKECLHSVLTIGLACSMDSPQTRMDMRKVIRELNLVKKAFVGV